MSSLEMHGKVAVVTGAGRGIGRAISLALARCGATVVLAARTPEQLEQTAREARAEGQGTKTLAVPCDVAVETQVVAMFAQAHAQFGRVDILINNAGMGLFGPVAEQSADAFDRVLAVNLRGTFLCAREAMKIMIPQKSGTIINMASVVGFKGYPSQGAYGAAKHGVMGLTKVLAVEGQPHGVRVAAVLPGGVDTEMVAQARPDLDRSVLLQPDDIAQTVLYLLSLSPRAAVDEIYIRRWGAAPF